MLTPRVKVFMGGVLSVLLLLSCRVTASQDILPTDETTQFLTNTPASTEMSTPLPTNTPVPTETPIPLPTETRLPTNTPTPRPTNPVDGAVIVYVQEGEFIMGSEDGWDDLRPVHAVYLDAFWIYRTEVTNDQFAAFVEAIGYRTEAERIGSSWININGRGEEREGANWQHPQGPDSDLVGLGNYPVIHVSWNDAVAYCRWAGGSLPTEAQWEKAARGELGRGYPWGNAFNGHVTNFCDANCELSHAYGQIDDGYAQTAPVGSYLGGASPYGALDMAGNVWEWVQDWYSWEYYGVSPDRNPAGPAYGTERVIRGGAWNGNEFELRSFFRWSGTPDVTGADGGFRCVLSP